MSHKGKALHVNRDSRGDETMILHLDDSRKRDDDSQT